MSWRWCYGFPSGKVVRIASLKVRIALSLLHAASHRVWQPAGPCRKMWLVLLSPKGYETEDLWLSTLERKHKSPRNLYYVMFSMPSGPAAVPSSRGVCPNEQRRHVACHVSTLLYDINTFLGAAQSVSGASCSIDHIGIMVTRRSLWDRCIECTVGHS